MLIPTKFLLSLKLKDLEQTNEKLRQEVAKRDKGIDELKAKMLKTDDIHPPKTGISVHFSCSLS